MERESCDGVRLDLDNTHGGNEGPETITYHGIADNDNYIYMIYVDDYSNRPDQFKTSDARITITNGVQTVRVKMATEEFADEKSKLFKSIGCEFVHLSNDAQQAIKKYVANFSVNIVISSGRY